MKEENPEEQVENVKYSIGINIVPFSYRGGCC